MDVGADGAGGTRRRIKWRSDLWAERAVAAINRSRAPLSGWMENRAAKGICSQAGFGDRLSVQTTDDLAAELLIYSLGLRTSFSSRTPLLSLSG